MHGLGRSLIPSDPFIRIYDDALSVDDCNTILRVFTSSSNAIPAFAGGYYSPDQKKGTSLKLSFCSKEDESNIISPIILPALTERMKLYKNRFPFLSSKIAFWRLDDLYHVQHFGPNEGYFAIHCEQGGPPVAKRILTWLIYLNGAQCGTHFYHQDAIISARTGRLVLWPASWTHMHSGVIPNLDDKYIVSGWFSFC